MGVKNSKEKKKESKGNVWAKIIQRLNSTNFFHKSLISPQSLNGYFGQALNCFCDQQTYRLSFPFFPHLKIISYFLSWQNVRQIDCPSIFCTQPTSLRTSEFFLTLCALPRSHFFRLLHLFKSYSFSKA